MSEIDDCLIDCPLFHQIQTRDLAALLSCLSAKAHSYHKNDFIFREQDAATHVGIVLSGRVQVVQEDFWGNRVLLTQIQPGGLFAEAFSCAMVKQLPVSVIAAAPSRVLLIDYRRIITTCSSSCVFHAQLVANMMQILARKNIMLTRKVEHISKRTTREKLLSFLSALARENGSSQVSLPFNRQELADYLCVERSALSREISKMQKDGLLSYHKNTFQLNQSHL